jgi:hypothetical protein
MNSLDLANTLVEFSFESTMAENLPPAVFLHLSSQAGLYNAVMGLTGRLRLREGRFAETLEGRVEVILPLVARIMADPRHGRIRILAFRSLSERRFQDWQISDSDLGGCETVFGANLRARPARTATTPCKPFSASIHSIGTRTTGSARGAGMPSEADFQATRDG